MEALKAANDAGIVLGLKDFGTVARQDIDVLLFKEPDTFNLYLLALKELQEGPSSDRMGFFQIAGIHGLPNSPWDGVNGKGVISTNNLQGYCAHGVEQFPPWHRPYLAMMEQAIYKKMSEIADKYTNPQRKAAYLAAVKKFRLPYWDYFLPRDYNARFPGVRNRGTTEYPYDFGVPQILTVGQVTVRMYPNDNITQITNPLNHFHFSQTSGSLTNAEWSVSNINPNQAMRNDTIRYPRSIVPPVQAMNMSLNQQREDFTRLSLLFMEDGGYNRYRDFSTAGVLVDDPFGQVSGSLESVHGAYHIALGGSGGHMSQVPTAAFDPIFWLHHCQVDRWFAIWQASHPTGRDSWFRNNAAAEQVLLPFRAPKKSGSVQTYWNSNQSRDTKAFGYVYPDVAGLENLDTAASVAEVRKRFKDRYSWSRRLTPRDSTSVRAPPGLEPLDLYKAQVFQGISGFRPLGRSPFPPTSREAGASAFTAEKSAVPAGISSRSIGTNGANGSNGANEATESHLISPFMNLMAAAPEGVFATKVAPSQEVLSPKSSNPEESIDEPKVSREWYVDDVVERLALNTSFTIFYFIGKFDEQSPADWLISPALAGINHVFTAPVDACDNCGMQEQQAHLVSSTSPVTSILLDYVANGELGDMKPAEMQPFLIANLKWRVLTVDGRVVNPRDLAEKGFKVSVSCKVSPLPGEQGEVVYETYPEIIASIIQNSG